MFQSMFARLRGEQGATSVEYGMIAFFIAVGVIVAVALLGAATHDNLDCAGQAWTTVSSC